MERNRTPGLVKICGLRQPEHAVCAVEAGADLVSFIFAPTRRQVTPEEARAVILAAKAAAGGREVRAVGVFVNAAPEEINDVIARAGLDLIQLSGQEPPALLAQLSRPAMKAVFPEPGADITAIEDTFQQFTNVTNAPEAFLVDGYVAGRAGGTGVQADWDLARTLAVRWPVCLAGGLNQDNVSRAVALVRPVAIDVSGGVETDGVKDPSKIVAFVHAAKSAFSALAARPRS